MDTETKLTINDTFGRLPDDVLKYMLLLNTVPKITFLKTSIKIELPLIGLCYNFIFNNFLLNEQLKLTIHFINEFNNDIISKLDFGDSQIYLQDKSIYFYDECSTFTIDIEYLQLVKNALEEYKCYLQNHLK